MNSKSQITLHPIRNSWYIESQHKFQLETIEEYIKKVAVKPSLLSSLAGDAIKAGVNDLASKGDKESFLDKCRISHLARVWHWRGMHQEGPNVIALPNEPQFETGPIASNSDVDLGSWLQGIYIAMILRDINAVKVYGEADPERVVRYGGNKPDPWEIPYIKFLNGIWAYDTNIGSYLKDALKGTDPGLYTPARADWIINILSPVMELWATVFTHNPDRFNAKLYEQQQLRHDWHAALGEESGNTIMEYIDLAALAAVCYAHDKGFKIEVQSDYLPEFLIKGDFPRLEWPDPEWKEWPK